MLCPRFFVEANWMIASPTGTTLKTNAPDVDPTGVTSSWLLAVLSAHVKEGWLDEATAAAPAEFMTFAAAPDEPLQELMTEHTAYTRLSGPFRARSRRWGKDVLGTRSIACV